VASIIVIVGITYFAVFLALVVDGVQDKMRALKQGVSAVVERNHTVILGWTDETVSIVREIALANASAGGGCIAILSERDKAELEHELHVTVRRRELRGTRVVFRCGSRLRAADLRKVATQHARAVVVVSDGRLDRCGCGAPTWWPRCA
jgi:fructose-1,6-bisphosphatase/inositol monophosphatase family enzyme